MGFSPCGFFTRSVRQHGLKPILHLISILPDSSKEHTMNRANQMKIVALAILVVSYVTRGGQAQSLWELAHQSLQFTYPP